jgi:predicted RNA-binding protein with PIN domain
MKTIILDAYNVIHKLPVLSVKLKDGLQEARRGLLNFMVDWKKKRGYKGDICIVFDGQDGGVNVEGSKLWGVKCVFTGSNEEADDRIISMVRKAVKASDIVVVSDDGKVANGCKVYGANIESPSFLKRKRKSKNSLMESRSKSSLSGSDERSIDKYYKEVLGLDNV